MSHVNQNNNFWNVPINGDRCQGTMCDGNADVCVREGILNQEDCLARKYNTNPVTILFLLLLSMPYAMFDRMSV